MFSHSVLTAGLFSIARDGHNGGARPRAHVTCWPWHLLLRDIGQVAFLVPHPSKRHEHACLVIDEVGDITSQGCFQEETLYS